jgi:hypothetical protein
LLHEANLALVAHPPQRDLARSALERAASAQDPSAASQAYYRLAILDEEDLEFDRALSHYARCMAAGAEGAGGRWADHANGRRQWLLAHSEDGFIPLVRLIRFKADPTLSAERDSVSEFSRDVETFPPGRVRAEARAFIAAALVSPLHRPDDAVPVFRKVTTDPSADFMTAVVAERGLVDALLAAGQIDLAAKEVEEHRSRLDEELVTRVMYLEGRRTLARTVPDAMVAVVVLAAVAYVLVRSRRRRRHGDE